jgi:hypothetical protein
MHPMMHMCPASYLGLEMVRGCVVCGYWNDAPDAAAARF